MTAGEFHRAVWRHESVLGAQIAPAWRPLLPRAAYLTLALVDGSEVTILLAEPEPIEHHLQLSSVFAEPPSNNQS